MDIFHVPVLSVLVILLLEFVSGQKEEKDPKKGHYLDWTPWTTCSQSCGSGLITRTKTWVQPPHEKKFEVPFTMTEHKMCSAKRCPVDGAWGAWLLWEPCSEACNGGTRQRTRTCVPPMFGGQFCEGDDFEEDECNRVPCPPLPPRFNLSACSHKHFMCSTREMCIPMDQLCDDTVQCNDGSDEKRCYEVDDVGSVRYLIKGTGSTTGATVSIIFSLVTMLLMTYVIG